MLVSETRVVASSIGVAVERRRPGRAEFDNAHLVRLCREPDAEVCDVSYLEPDYSASHGRWFPAVVLAALGFWYLALRLLL